MRYNTVTDMTPGRRVDCSPDTPTTRTAGLDVRNNRTKKKYFQQTIIAIYILRTPSESPQRDASNEPIFMWSNSSGVMLCNFSNNGTQKSTQANWVRLAETFPTVVSDP